MSTSGFQLGQKHSGWPVPQRQHFGLHPRRLEHYAGPHYIGAAHFGALDPEAWKEAEDWGFLRVPGWRLVRYATHTVSSTR
jgi:hypothetical protein